MVVPLRVKVFWRELVVSGFRVLLRLPDETNDAMKNFKKPCSLSNSELEFDILESTLVAFLLVEIEQSLRENECPAETRSRSINGSLSNPKLN